MSETCSHLKCNEEGIDWFYSGCSMVGLKVWACMKHGKEFET